MAYTRKRWENGEVITATALNNIEDGIVELKQANTQMSGSVNSSELHIGADTDTIDGKDGSLTVSHKITADELEVINTATFKNTTTFQGAVNVTGSKSSLTVPTPREDMHASTKQYVDERETNIKAITIGTGDGLSFSGSLGSSPKLDLTAAAQDKIGGIKVGTNLSIDSNGILSATDTTYGEATATTAGLMPAADRKKLEGIEKVGTVTGVQINGTVKEPNSGVVDLGTIITSHQDLSTKANLDSPKFSGVVNFGDQISIDANNNKITINQTDITEAQINALYNLPSIPPIPLNEAEGTYTLQAQKTGTNITYSWVLVGGE